MPGRKSATDRGNVVTVLPPAETLRWEKATESVAQDWVKDELASYVPQSITLEVFLERWAEGLEQDQIAVAVFPLPDAAGIVEEASELAETLADKLEQLEADAE